MDLVTQNQYDDMVNRIYEAGLQPERWSDVLDAVSKLIPSALCGLALSDAEDGVVRGLHNHDPAFVSDYLAYYRMVDVWHPLALSLQPGVAVLSEEAVPRDAVLRSEFYNEWLRPQKLVASAGLILHRDPQRAFSFSATMDRATVDACGPQVVELLQRLAPHLRRAFETGRRLAGQSVGEGLEPLMDRIPHPAFVLDAAGRVVLTNTRARDLCRAAQLVTIFSRNMLRVLDETAFTAMRSAIEAIGANRGVGGDFNVRARDGSQHIASLVPLRQSAPHDFLLETPGLTLLTFTPRPMVERLDANYGLTRAEIRLARALYAGETLQAYAERCRLSIHTVRNQLKAALGKTGLNRQAQLVALVSRLEPAAFGTQAEL